MTDPFAELIPEARAFLAELAASNTRDWFTEHKPRYDAQLKSPAQLLLDQVAADLTKTTGQRVTTKLFRPHRDVRFSKDKTPYHTHLHMLWQLEAEVKTGFFLGISPTYCRVGGGLMGFDKNQLIQWRDAVSGSAGQTVTTLLDDLARGSFTSDEPELKRVPAPFAKDHPQATLLRRKSLSVWADLPALQWGQPLTTVNSAFAQLLPLHALLIDILAGKP